MSERSTSELRPTPLPGNDHAEAKGHLQNVIQTVVQHVVRL